MWNELLRRLAVAVCGAPPPRVPPGVRRKDGPVDRWPAFIPERNPLAEGNAAGLRQQDVLSLMDDDCYGYLILSVRKEAVGPRGRIELAQQLDPSWWPAIGSACATIAAEAKGQA